MIMLQGAPQVPLEAGSPCRDAFDRQIGPLELELAFNVCRFHSSSDPALLTQYALGDGLGNATIPDRDHVEARHAVLDSNRA